MLTLSISQLLQTAEGSVPDAFTGVVKKVFPSDGKPAQAAVPATATSPAIPEKKEWKLQKLIVVEGSHEIEVMLSTRPDVPASVVGSKIFCVAKDGQRGRVGLKRKNNVWKQKTTPQVFVDERADVTFDGAPSAAAPAPAPAPQRETAPPATGGGRQHQQQQQNQPAEPLAPGEAKAKKDAARAASMKGFDKRLARAGAALNRCFDSAYQVVASVNARHGETLVIKPTPELIEKIAMGLMVNTCWTQKPADDENFPMKPFQSYDEKTGAALEKPATAPFN